MVSRDDEHRSGSDVMAGSPGARARQHLALSHVPHMLYGAVVVGSVLADASVDAPAGSSVVLAAIAVAIVYWFSHVYIDAVGGRFVDPDHSTGSRMLSALNDNWSVLFGAVPPIGALLIALALGEPPEIAAWMALWVTVILLVVVGAVAAWRGGARRWALVGEILIAGFFGLLVILLKYALH